MKKFLKYVLNYKKNSNRLEYPLNLESGLGVLSGNRYFKIETIELELMIANPNDTEKVKEMLLERAKLKIADMIFSSVKINKMGKLLEIKYPICVEEQ